MIIILHADATNEQKVAVIAEVERQGYRPHPIFGEHLTVVAVVGKHPGALREYFESLDGVDRVVLIDQPYKLVARAERPHLRFTVGRDTVVGGDKLTVIAGPCSVESEEQMTACAEAAKASGAAMLRGGAFKPRTSPYAFMGLGEEGLRIMAAAREATGLPIISEVMDPRQVELCARYLDMLQVGARNMQNFSLLSEVGKAGVPVMLKRGMAATIEDLLNAAEYIAAQGEERILLCERGIRTYETATRNTLDINAVPVLHRQTHLPLCVDPSHAVGVRELVGPVACAAAAAGADALMIEIHPDPATAKSDGAQALTFDMFEKLMRRLDRIPRYDYTDEHVG
ncbi:MAG: 3-deoxy-7-phosphoheptulonate synthase [Armatimonadetes bacterium]|nr:3-deoxy-7-phosphoheptulonate synthase [Armatimonadota bacterium]